MKIKLPTLKSGAPKRPPKLKLKASVARSRRAPIVEDDDEYFDEPEPNMKLSHAFVVVLVLHVIAVAGVFAFNTIKTKQDSVLAATKPDAIDAPEIAPADVAPAASNAAPAAAAAQPDSGPRKHVMMAGETLTKIAAQYGVTVAALQELNAIDDPTKLRIGTSLAIPEPGAEPAPKPVAPVASVSNAPAPAPATAPAAQAKPEPAAAAAVASGTIYEVVKGDNPVTIAKKFNVSQTALMEINGIDDPRKLQIGQKLKIPTSN